MTEGRRVTSICYQQDDSAARPWGTWRVTDITADAVTKHIIVHANSRTSLQTHRHRSEQLTVMQGTVDVLVDNATHTLRSGDSLTIQPDTPHRIANPTNHPAELIEVQTGTTLDEADINRLADDYGRA